MVDVSIILVNYNSTRLILNCLDSIEKKTTVSYEILIVDNCSNENIDDLLIRESNNVHILKSKENLGFGKANNLALPLAKGRNVLFLNPDTILMNSAIVQMTSFLDNNVNVGACGGNLYDSMSCPTRSFKRYFPSVCWELCSTFSYSVVERIFYGKNRFFNNTDKPINVAYIVGADLMVKREVLNQLKVCFNPLFFMYYEEIELCYRIHKLGYQLINVPAAKIQHLEGKSTKASYFKAEQHFKSINQYYKLCYPSYKYKMFKLIYIMKILSRLLYFKLSGKPNFDYWKLHFRMMLNKS